MVEVDTQDKPGSWWSLVWLGLAVIGMIWLIKTGGELFSAAVRRERREPTIPLRRRDSPRIRGSTRTIACMTMSTRMKGQGLRFQPTKEIDEGAFIDGLPVNQNVEMDSKIRDICDRCATCNKYMGREKVLCRTCFKSVHDFCVGKHVHQHIRG